jgi:predicted DNA-binding antitoxin AbrB/MazE fold protein
MQQQLRAIYESGVFRPLDVVGLKEHQEVLLVLETEESHHEDTSFEPIWEFAAELARELPDEEWAQLPADGATELNHYLYGARKQQ